MRDTRKPDEDRAIQAVTHALKDQGSTVGDDTRTVQDAPDWVFDFDGTGVAAECTCINLEQLMRWSNTTARLVPEKCYSITFPKEPHLWIKKAIEAKERKIETYVKNSGAEEVWLIAHDSFDQVLALYECDPEMLDFMKRAASALDSEFSRIWFVHSEAGCHQLWRKGDEVVPFPELDLSSGNYPTGGYKMGISTVTGPGNFEFSVGPENTVESILLQPLDTRYQL